MNFNKMEDNNYNTFSTMEVYGLKISPYKQPYFYDYWVINTDIFDQVIDY